MVGKDGCDAEQKIVIAADIGFEDHVDVDVGFRIGNVAQDGDMVIPPFLTGCIRRTYAAIFSFWAGVIPPMPMFGRSLL